MAGLIRLFICVLVLGNLPAATNHALAQRGLSPTKKLDQYSLSHWDSDSGMPTNTVIRMLQTRKGYVYLASFGGLVRFNGYDFYTFSTNNTKELQNNAINNIYEDTDGSLWACTESGGLTNFHQQGNQLYLVADGLPSNAVETIVRDGRGMLWVGTSGGLAYFDTLSHTFVQSNIPGILKKESISTLLPSGRSELWVGTLSKGLFLIKEGKIQAHYAEEQGQLPDNHINRLLESKNGGIWAGTDHGLCYIENGKSTHFDHIQNLENHTITSVFEDLNQDLWVGTFSGISRIKKNAQGLYAETFPEGHQLRERHITDIMQDREGNLWFSTYRHGIYKLTDGKFTNYSKYVNEADYVVHAVVEISPDSIALVGRKEIALVNRQTGSMQDWPGLGNFERNAIKSATYDALGRLWICTRRGVICHQKGKSKVYGLAEGLVDDNTRLVEVARNGDVWIGTYSGLTCIRAGTGKIDNYTPQTGLPAELVLSVHEDSEGDVWVGTRNGLAKIDKGHGAIHTFNRASGLSGDVIFRIYEDSEGVLWIGTSTGLTRYKNGTFKAIYASNGLAADIAFQLLEDDLGYLWFMTNASPIGIFKVLKKDINDFMDGKAPSVTSVVFTRADGLKSSECTANGIALRAKDGSLWFPTLKGAEMIHPNKIFRNDEVPPVVIESFIVDNQSYNIHQPIEFTSGRHRIDIGFAALSYIAPTAATYQYKLEGYDTDWEDSQRKRDVFYTNLPYGKYTFKVRACNNDRVWNEEGASITFEIVPQPWERPSARLLAALLAIGAASFFYRRRITRIDRQRKLLEKLVEERTVELEKGNHVLKEQAETLGKQKEEIQKQRDDIEASNKKLSNALNEIKEQNMLIELKKTRLEYAQEVIKTQNMRLKEINAGLEDMVNQRTQELHQAYQALQHSHDELDKFIYRSAHDLKGPITRILGLYNVMRMQSSQADPELMACLEQLRGTSEEMKQKLFHLTRTLEAKSKDIEWESVNLAGIVNDVLRPFQSADMLKDIEVMTEIPPRAYLRTDRVLLIMLLENLVQNSIKFKKKGDGAYIKIEARLKDNAFLLISVKDNGLGIPSGVQEKIFDMFFVANEQKKGAGLGLYESKVIAEKLKGSIRLELGNANETEFVIMLPLH